MPDSYRRGLSRPVRWLRSFPCALAVLARWAWWNVFSLAGAALLAGLALSSQGAELGVISARRPWPQLLGQIWLLWLVAMQFFLAGHVVARAADAQVQGMARSIGLSAQGLRLWMQQVLPAVLACGLGLLLVGGTIAPWPGVAWSAGWLVLAVTSMALVCRFSGQRWTSQDASAAALLVLLCIGIPLLPLLWAEGGLVGYSREAGTLGMAALGIGLWALLLTLVFVALPLQAGSGSWAPAAPALWWLAALLADPNPFPRGIDATALAATPLPLLRQAQRPTLVYLAVMRWLRQFEHLPGDGPIPLVLVSAEGGGIRAAYWTAEVLARLNVVTSGKLAAHTVAYSGVSGGAFGVTAFVLGTREPGLDAPTLQSRLRGLMADDYLAPLAGAMTLTEPLWQLLPYPGLVPPRDRVFEQAWEQSWQRHFGTPGFAQPFWQAFEIHGAQPPAPMVVLNTTNVETGKRVIVSNIGLTTQQLDFFELFALPGVAEVVQQMSISAAAHLSARFPYLSPPAAVQSATPIGAAGGTPSVALRTWGHLVDGGYFDNSGAVVIQDLVKDLHDLWRDAHLGNEHSTSLPELNWERDRKLLRRLRVLVLVLRNDPFSGERADRLDFPTLSADADLATDPDAQGAQYNGGQFLGWLPRFSPLAELWSPPATMLAAREARGATSRRLLSTHIRDMNFSQQLQCELHDRARRGVPLDLPIRYTAGCLNEDFSRYIEVSLADALDLLHQPPGDGELPMVGDMFCPPWLAPREIALGWVLSSNSARAMQCAAVASDKLRDAADWLDPDGAAARRPVSRPVVLRALPQAPIAN